MKLTPLSRSIKNRVTPNCIAIEYPNGDKDIWGAIIKLTGRYPEKGRTVNLKCKELVYFIEGKGKLVINDKEVKVKKGDQLVIDVGEKYYWEGKFVMFVPCTPAWYPEQHKEVI